MTFATVGKRVMSSIVPGTIEKSLIVNPNATKKTLIWMHGLGDTNHGFADIFSQIANNSIRVVLLHAPIQAVTMNGGMKMPSWYDILDLSRTEHQEDKQGIIASAKLITTCIDEELQRMKDIQNNGSSNDMISKNIFVGGFSQGGAMAIYTSYRYSQTLGGVICLSSYILQMTEYPKCIHKSNENTKLMVCHGIEDPMVPQKLFEPMFVDTFSKYIPLSYEAIPYLQHEISPLEIEKVCDFVMTGEISRINDENNENENRSKL